jgi:sialic acid synthase SpsE
VKIADFEIGHARRPMIVAELGAAHNGRLSTALALIEEAKARGADAVKVQCFTPDTITTDGPGQELIIPSGPWAGRNMYELYTKTHMPRAWFAPMFELAAKLDIPLFASVFSVEDLDFIKQFNPPAYKIASFEMIDTPLVKAAADVGKPLIISTGMASWPEIYKAHAVISPERTIWLHCISTYPVEIEKAKMGFFVALREKFYNVGLSDHSRGTTLGVVATARGALMIEKHMTLTPDGAGEDDHFASSPAAFGAFVKEVRAASASFGFTPTATPVDPNEGREHAVLRRSLYVVEDVIKGQLLTTWNVRSIRPGAGLSPELLTSVIGRRARRDIAKGSPLQWELMEPEA